MRGVGVLGIDRRAGRGGAALSALALVLLGCDGEDWLLEASADTPGDQLVLPAPRPYTTTPLPGRPGGTLTVAHALGNDDRVVGEADGCEVSPGRPRSCSRAAVVWDVGQPPVVLPALPGTVSSKATGITDGGLIVGTSVDAGGRTHGWRFTAQGGTTEVLGPRGEALYLAAASTSGWATGIYRPNGSLGPHAFRVDLGTGAFQDLFPDCVRTLLERLRLTSMIPPGSPPGDCLNGRDLVATRGFSVDALGNVAGELEVGVGQFQYGYLWRAGGAEPVNLHALNNTIDVQEASALGGALVGPYVAWDGSTRTWTWSMRDGGLLGDAGIDVGFFPSAASTEGRLVGYRTTGPQIPLSWRGGTSTVLGVPDGLRLGDAVAVNRCGNAAGNAVDASFRPHALRWTRARCD